ncbi:MAG: hypothetical protein ACXVBE_02975 [Bdellovibrionota bacterium]
MKKSMMIAALGILLAFPVWGIGRSGNGTINSSVTGFNARSPANFGISENLSGARLRLISPMVDIRPGFVSQPFLELGEVDQLLPNLVKLERAELRSRLAELGWTVKVVGDPCIDAYIRNSEDGDLISAFWGVSKGLVVIGPHSPYVRNGEREILSTLKLEAGACAW